MSYGSKHVFTKINSPRNQRQSKRKLTVSKVRMLGRNELVRPDELRDGGLHGGTKFLDISIFCALVIAKFDLTETMELVGYSNKGTHPITQRILRINVKNWYSVYSVVRKGLSIDKCMNGLFYPPKRIGANGRGARRSVYRTFLCCKFYEDFKKLYPNRALCDHATITLWREKYERYMNNSKEFGKMLKMAKPF
jgi:hypothetical protein